MKMLYCNNDLAPAALPIIHLGATSCFVGDNTDIIQMRDSMKLLRSKLVYLLSAMKSFALKHKNEPTLGFTHLQPAQLTTVGKRCAMWMQDFVMVYCMIQPSSMPAFIFMFIFIMSRILKILTS